MTLDTYLSDIPVYTDKDHLIWTTLFKRNQSLKNLSSIYISKVVSKLILVLIRSRIWSRYQRDFNVSLVGH